MLALTQNSDCSGQSARRIDKRVESVHAAVDGISDGSIVLISGFGSPGNPVALIHGLLRRGTRDLTVVANNGGVGHDGLAALLEARRVRKLICSYPRSAGSVVIQQLYAARQIEVEIVPQGTLSERIRAGAAGLGGFYTPTAAGTELSLGKEHREIGGRLYVLETPIRADFALVSAYRGDRWGNLVYRGASRNYGPTMAMAARCTIAQVESFSEVPLNPELIVTPGIFVHRVVVV